MAKQLFGNLVTYSGKYLSKATAKAKNGNLVFARITKSTELDPTHEDYDKDGYYIYAGGAEGHMVNKADFDSFKADAIARIAELERLTDMPQDAETGKEMTVTAYVAAQIAALQLGDASKKGVAAGVTADEEGLTTGAQVYSHVSGAVATLESSISNVAGSLENYVLKTSVKDSFDGAADGDVASVGAVKSYVSGIVGDELGSAAYKDVAAGVTADEAGLTSGAQVYSHVSGEIAALQLGDASKKGVAATVTADGADLPTASAVASYVSGAISAIGTVLVFKGVVAELPSTTEGYATGDVIIVGDKEYVCANDTWQLFGDVTAEAEAISNLQTAVATNSDAIATLSATVGAIAGENAIGFDGEKITLKLATGANAGNVTLAQDANGLKADVTLPTAETLAYAGETLEGETKPTTDATNVKDALNDLFISDKVTAEALVDLNGRLADISGAVDAVSTTVSGDAASYSVVEGDFATGFTVKNTLATADAAGLATDAYVTNAIETALTWEVISNDGE